ncbi:hypothetical protein [Burkholderia gladioli]|uniref:hypothetical protein n=1 Tax=Burkholderia gladioli TaxID=28095 RepID=UPI0016404C0C|nr:hypothetical protein [Burkholderia gladioli]
MTLQFPVSLWRPMDSAPRDGSNIIVRFPFGDVSQAMYVIGSPMPWKFIDTRTGISWLINFAADGPGGPTGWMPLAAATPEVRRPAGAPATTPEQLFTALVGARDVMTVMSQWGNRDGHAWAMEMIALVNGVLASSVFWPALQDTVAQQQDRGPVKPNVGGNDA